MSRTTRSGSPWSDAELAAKHFEHGHQRNAPAVSEAVANLGYETAGLAPLECRTAALHIVDINADSSYIPVHGRL